MEEDMEVGLVQQFSCLGTTDKEVLVAQLQKLVGPQLNTSAAHFFLDMNNWNLQLAIGAYFDLIEDSQPPPPPPPPPPVVHHLNPANGMVLPSQQPTMVPSSTTIGTNTTGCWTGDVDSWGDHLHHAELNSNDAGAAAGAGTDPLLAHLRHHQASDSSSSSSASSAISQRLLLDHQDPNAAGCFKTTVYSMSIIEDMSVPEDTIIPPRTKFVKRWNIKNNGGMPWPTGSHLRIVSGNRGMVAQEKIFINPQVQPCESRQVFVECHAPENPGSYQTCWQMSTPEGFLFGDEIWVICTVGPDLTVDLTQQLQSLSCDNQYQDPASNFRMSRSVASSTCGEAVRPSSDPPMMMTQPHSQDVHQVGERDHLFGSGTPNPAGSCFYGAPGGGSGSSTDMS